MKIGEGFRRRDRAEALPGNVDRRRAVHGIHRENFQRVAVFADGFEIISVRVTLQALDLPGTKRFAQVRFPSAQVPAIEQRPPRFIGGQGGF